MTETISLAGMTETPFVCVLAQRPGPATGLPTWSSASDLNVAVYGGHGEFPRCVLAASDAGSSYYLIQKAFALAEQFQIPVILLTEKQIAESLFNLRKMPKDISIERYLVPPDQWKKLSVRDRYRSAGVVAAESSITESATAESEGGTSGSEKLAGVKYPSGVSPRWLPGDKAPPYLANSDEHGPAGDSTEYSILTVEMQKKRMSKLRSLKHVLPEPRLYGSRRADLVLVGWGSVKNAVLDALDEAKKQSGLNFSFSYLHYDALYPLRTRKFKQLQAQARKMILVENNYQGQLGNLLRQETGYKFTKRILKYDGRPFMVDEILQKLRRLGNKIMEKRS